MQPWYACEISTDYTHATREYFCKRQIYYFVLLIKYIYTQTVVVFSLLIFNGQNRDGSWFVFFLNVSIFYLVHISRASRCMMTTDNNFVPNFKF